MIEVNGIKINPSNYPDGSLMVRAPKFKNLTSLSFVWKYENDAELFTLQCLRYHWGKIPATLKILYCPHARMDRVKNIEDVFTLKTFAKIINNLDFRRVIMLDAHSNVAPALFENCYDKEATPYILATINKMERSKGKENLALFFPDNGAMKRYTDYRYGIPFSYGIKDRDWDTGVILGLKIENPENIKDKDVLIIDDICSKGTTFYYSAKALLDAGAKSVSLYVTHCENTILEGELLTSGLVEKVYTTNSIFTKGHKKIEVFEV